MQRIRQKPVPELTISYILFLALIVWIPFPNGSNRPWSWSLMELVTFGLMFVVFVSGGIRGKRSFENLSHLKIPIILGSVWLIYLALQTINMPASMFTYLATPATLSVNDLMIRQYHLTSLSVDQYSTWSELLKNSSYLCLMILTGLLITTRTRVQWLVLVMGLACLGEISYGIYDVLSGGQYGRLISGTFVNHSHLSGLLELSMPLVLAFTAYIIRHYSGEHSLHSVLLFKGMLLALSSVMIVGLVLAGSRGGILATLASCVMLGLLLVPNWLRDSSKATKIGFLVVVMGVFAIALMASDGVLQRFSGGGISGREYLLQLAPNMLADSWLRGLGAGNLQYVFPWYHNDGGPYQFWRAHNDYIELLFDQGIVGFSIVAAGVVFVLKSNYQALKASSSTFQQHMLTGTLFSQVILLVHGLSDFNFYIPSNAAYYFIIVGLVFSLQRMGQARKKKK